MARSSQLSLIYLALLDGKTVTVPVVDKNEFNTIRVALHKYHRSMREIGGSELSLQATLIGLEASYRLGESRLKKNYNFTIEEDHGEKV